MLAHAASIKPIKGIQIMVQVIHRIPAVPGVRRNARMWITCLLLACASVLVAPRSEAANVVYVRIQTLPVPPASAFAGSGGGDGSAAGTG